MEETYKCTQGRKNPPTGVELVMKTKKKEGEGKKGDEGSSHCLDIEEGNKENKRGPKFDPFENPKFTKIIYTKKG